MKSLAKCIQAAKGPEELKNALADFHVLCFIESTGTFSKEEFQQLCQLVTSKDGDISQLNQLNGWNTLEMVLKEAGKIIRVAFFISF